jgi:hypothetical protein
MIMRGRDQVIKTYRYLRLSMVMLTVLLGISVGYASIEGKKVLDSISSYYYTPAHSVFVGCLVAIGVGLIALRGNTDVEDVFLNLAGMLAPIVAFVPCWRGEPTDDTVRQIENNVWSMLATSLLVVVVAAVVAKWGRTLGEAGALKPSDVVGLTIALVMVLAAAAWFALWHDGFIHGAHYTAAISMFVFIALAVLVNTKRGARFVAWIADHVSHDPGRRERWNPQRDGRSHFGRAYGWVFALMIAVQALWSLSAVWDQTILAVEASMIGLFAVFWALQTWDLRNTDLDEEV